MAKYTTFWQNLLKEFSSKLDSAKPLEQTFADTGIENLGNRQSYSGYLEVFGCGVKKYTSSQVFVDLERVVSSNNKLKNQVTGLLNIRVDKNNSVTFSYQPFSWELMMNRYRDYQDKTQMVDELYKWLLVQKFQDLWTEYEADTLSFKDLMEKVDFGNLVYHMFTPNFIKLVQKVPGAAEQALLHLYDLDEPLQERVSVFSQLLHDQQKLNKEKPNDQLFLAEREIATLLTFRYPEQYTFFIPSFYNPLVKALGRKNPEKWYQLRDYYEIVDNFKREVLPKYEDAIAVKNRLTEGDEYYQDNKHLLLIQDIFYITFMKDSKDLTDEVATEDETTPKYWIYSPGEGATKWDEFYELGIMALGWDDLGDLKQYQTKKDITKTLQQEPGSSGSRKNDSTANDEFANVVSIGDYIIVKKGKSQLLGLGQVVSDYYYEESAHSFKSRRNVKWLKKGEWDSDHDLVLKTLTDISDYKDLEAGFDYYYERLLDLMEDKTQQTTRSMEPLNQILYGPPGTGKTYNTIDLAVRIASSDEHVQNKRVANQKIFDELIKEEQIVFTTFHQSLSYEDFIEGIKPLKPIPNEGYLKYDIQEGIFKSVCEKARSNFENAKSGNQKKIPFELALEKLKEDLEENREMKFPLRTPGYDFTIIGFTNTSSIPAMGNVNYQWFFGDGNTSSQQSPVYSYSSPGNYSACLIISVLDSNNNTICSDSICKNVPVGLGSCQAGMLLIHDPSIPAGYGVNNIPNPSAALVYDSSFVVYDFGNGYTATHSPAIGSSHYNYSTSGTYQICLTNFYLYRGDTVCFSTACSTVVVSLNKFCQASYIVDTANSYQGNVFIWNTSTPSNNSSIHANSYQWNFGDGNTSNQPFPVHTYANPGVYAVCLTLTSVDSANNICTDTFCDTLGVDSLGNLIYKTTSGFTLNVLDPNAIGLKERIVEEFAVYPNPANDMVTMAWNEVVSGEMKWQITDLKGAVLMKGAEDASNKKEMQLNVSRLKAGVYILSASHKNSPVAHYKLRIN